MVYLDSELGLPLNFREPAVQKLLVDSLDRYETFFDVGANIGAYAILACRAEHIDVHAFEPHPENVARLRENVSLNGLNHQISVVPKAVSDDDGETTLWVGSPLGHSLTQGNGEEIPIESVKLDSYASSQGVSPDIVKLDVEGAGAMVLEGATYVLEEGPDWVTEFHNRSEMDAFKEAFDSFGYRVKRLTERHFFASRN